tara:strand:- start:181 stop:357 length:177 start_codon:yes stop_codon:yes gene_type:complete
MMLMHRIEEIPRMVPVEKAMRPILTQRPDKKPTDEPPVHSVFFQHVHSSLLEVEFDQA